jgi:hypothetical protein
MIEARQDAECAHLDQQQLTADHAAARAVLRQDIGAGRRPSSLEAWSTKLCSHAQQARRTLAEIEALPIIEAAQLIRYGARGAAERTAAAALRARAAEPSPWHPPSPMHDPSAERDFGPSL